MDTSEVYLMYINELNLYKIGVSKNTKKRIKHLQTGCPYLIEIRHVFKSKYPYKVELALHNELRAFKVNIDDVKLKGEWFNLEFEHVNNFNKKCSVIEKNLDFLIDSGNKFILS